MAHAACETEKRAGDQLDVAETALMLGKPHRAIGDKEEAEGFLEDAVTRFQ